MSFSLLGIGSQLLDILITADEAFLEKHVPGKKGGMEPLESREIERIVDSSGSTPGIYPGGAAGNTVLALSMLGVKTALRGKIARDEMGRRYLEFASRYGADTSNIIISPQGSTGCCLAVVTSDAERTMRSALGVSLELTDREISESDFSSYDAVLVEGFMAYSGVLECMVKSAKNAGKCVIFDLASFEIASKFKPLFLELMPYVDILVANRSEAAAFTGTDDPVKSLAELREIVPCAAVKDGAEGVWFSGYGEEFFVPSIPVADVVDTTAAGDLWLAGFVYGRDKGMTLRKSVWCGTLFASKIIRHQGAVLSSEDVAELKKELI
jgi:sugar/nucleoside kinase (ribokinase family)